MSKNRFLNMSLTCMYHLIITVSLLFAGYLYSDDYNYFPWATRDESLKFLHLIFTLPFPFILALGISLFIKRKRTTTNIYLIRPFPVYCLILVSGYVFFIGSVGSVMRLIGFGICISLIVIEILSMIVDLKNSLTQFKEDGNIA